MSKVVDLVETLTKITVEIQNYIQCKRKKKRKDYT